ncbi:MAG: hypothetical protein ABSF77_01750 [Spirochaetia bacterium]|jgi:hypothetical protein
MKPLISEFSYGYALTEELAGGALGSLIAAPIFPSLIREGRAGGGFDVQIPAQGFPMYLQFKLSDCLLTAKAREWNIWQRQYYRIHLHARNKSNQHQLLIDLETAGNNVFYAAPCFYTLDELNSAYLGSNVFADTAFFSPVDIGPLADRQEHYVAFTENNPQAVFCSKEPRYIQANPAKQFAQKLSTLFESKTNILDSAFFRKTVDLMRAVFESTQLKLPKDEEISEHYGRLTENRLQYASTAAYLSRAYLNAELYIVGASRTA